MPNGIYTYRMVCICSGNTKQCVRVRLVDSRWLALRPRLGASCTARQDSMMSRITLSKQHQYKYFRVFILATATFPHSHNGQIRKIYTHTHSHNVIIKCPEILMKLIESYYGKTVFHCHSHSTVHNDTLECTHTSHQKRKILLNNEDIYTHSL